MGDEARITLYGEKEADSIVYDNAIEAGNKILANTALISMYGNPRKHRTRLLQTVEKGETSILIEKGLGWKAGEEVGLAPTTIRYFESDQLIIKSYDGETGILEFTSPLKYYHWGAPESTADRYNGVDMRGEVMLLSRNIKIVGDMST